MTLNTSEIVALVAGSSVLAAIVTQILNELRDGWKKKQDGGFSALYLALALESYAAECASLIGDSENFEVSDGHAGSAYGNIASLPDFPDSIEWKPLGLRATTQAMSLRVDIETTSAMITGSWDFGDEEDIVPIVRLEAARLGSQALALSKSLREMGKIEALSFADPKWNVAVYLETKFKELTLKKEQWEKQNQVTHQKLMESLEPAQTA